MPGRKRNLSFAAIVCLLTATPLAAQDYTFELLAGPRGGSGSHDGAAAQFGSARELAVDAQGNIYVADGTNSTIRKITPSGYVTTLAGRAGERGHRDGFGGEARFDHPSGIASDVAGNLYVTDYSHVIRKITPAGLVTTVAGLAGVAGSDDGVGANARFHYPSAIAVDGAGSLYVADRSNGSIRKISTHGEVTTFQDLYEAVGVAIRGDGAIFAARWDGVVAQFTTTGEVVRLYDFAYELSAIAIDANGMIWGADVERSVILSLDPATARVALVAGDWWNAGYADGVGPAAQFIYPEGVAVGPDALYIGDAGSHAIRRMSWNAEVTTVAGVPMQRGAVNGTGTTARFQNPVGIAALPNGDVAVADRGLCAIRRVTPAGVVSTIAGSLTECGDAYGIGIGASGSRDVAADHTGNLFFINGHHINKITPGGIVTLFAGGSPQGFIDGAGSEARFHFPKGLATDSSGNVLVADGANSAIRKISPAGSVATVLVIGDSYEEMNRVAVNEADEVFFTSTPNNLWKVQPNGTYERFADAVCIGGGEPDCLDMPYSLAFAPGGDLFVSDVWWGLKRVSPEEAISTFLPIGNDDDATTPHARAISQRALAFSVDGTLYLAQDGIVRVGRPTSLQDRAFSVAASRTGELVSLDTAPQTASSWRWKIVQRPPSSVAALTSTTTRQTTFTPDAVGTYVIEVRAEGAAGVRFSRTAVTACNVDARIDVPLSLAAGTGGFTASVPAIGGATYAWSADNGTIDAGQGTNQVTFTTGASLLPLTLSVTVTSPLGCSLTGTSSVALTGRPTFVDVPATHPFYDFVERLYSNGVTGGCGNGKYCPDASVTRAQMAVFLLAAKNGSTYLPPAATGNAFVDVAINSFAAAWIEQLTRDGVTGGCGNGQYCPSSTTTRAQMAVFLLSAKNGQGYAPPSCNRNDVRRCLRRLFRCRLDRGARAAGNHRRLLAVALLSGELRDARADGGVPGGDVRIAVR